MSDEKQNSAVYFDTVALSWNTNDAGGTGENEGMKAAVAIKTQIKGIVTSSLCIYIYSTIFLFLVYFECK